MPFKSNAQRRKFAELLVTGKISNETFEEWNRETGGAKLPERVQAQGQGEIQNQGQDRGQGKLQAQGEMIRQPAVRPFLVPDRQD
jgi:hypothetical protein